MKVTLTNRGDLDPCAEFFTAGDCEKLVYCPTDRTVPVHSRLGHISTVVDAGRPVEIRRVCEDLSARGVQRLVVEGGGALHTQFLTADLADQLDLVVAPFFVGDSRAHRFVGDGEFPWHSQRRARAGRGAADRRRRAAAVRAVAAIRDRVRREGRPMTADRPMARVRTQVAVPLRFTDGYSTQARVITFTGLVDDREHIAVGLGRCADPSVAGLGTPLVRLHSECLTGDVLGSQRCDCGAQLREAVELIADAGGYLLYLRQEGRGIGLYAKIDAYALQDTGLDTYEANLALGYGEDERDYAVSAQMLHALGAPTVRVLSNNPDKIRQLRRYGVAVVEQLPTGVHVSAANSRYLATKVRRGDHTLTLPGPDHRAPA